MKVIKDTVVGTSIDFEGTETTEALVYRLAILDFMEPILKSGYDVVLIRNHPSTKLLVVLVDNERMRVHNMLADRIKDE